MNHYISEVHRIGKICFSNQHQLQTAIDTKRYIDVHYDQELNLDLLAKIQLTSKFHLLRIFKKYYGQTPKQYQIEKRIENAKAFLAKGETVTSTCFAVGFQSLGSFIMLFKRKTGKKPSAYQNEQLSRRSSNPKG